MRRGIAHVASVIKWPIMMALVFVGRNRLRLPDESAWSNWGDQIMDRRPDAPVRLLRYQ